MKPICGSIEVDCKCGLIIYPLSKVKVGESSLGLVSSPTMGFWADLQYQAWVSSHGTALKSSPEVVTIMV